MTFNTDTETEIKNHDNLKSFISKSKVFLESTREHSNQSVNPGGVYQAISCRDASYILQDWFISGNTDGTLLQIHQIWSHQIRLDAEEPLVYGRGSPNTKFSAIVASDEKKKELEWALPTTIYQTGFSEVYGRNPDIDSTALMISTTSWILANWHVLYEKTSSDHNNENSESTVASEHSADYVNALLGKIGVLDPIKITKDVVPRMQRAIEYLSKRDNDNDGLLEQGHNEDWMDTALRNGKIVYSQGCWLLALTNFSFLLSTIGMDDEALRLKEMSDRVVNAVNQKLWSEEEGCYLDLRYAQYEGKSYRILTEDTTSFLVGLTQHTDKNSIRVLRIKKGLSTVDESVSVLDQSLHNRALRTLKAIENRTWKDKWPLVTETELRYTGPWILKPYEYHNHTFWPWIAGVEMLARSRFNQIEECGILFSKIISDGKPNQHAFFEWINPITDQGQGSFPFRTGISTIRLAIVAILVRLKEKFRSLFTE